MAADVLYITFDGILQPLAFSQVVRVVAGLARRGLRYHLLSVERPADLERPGSRTAVDALLGPAGVAWTPVVGGSMAGPRGAAEVVGRVALAADRVARAERVRLVHARGYHSAFVARTLKRLRGLPYLFDARGYWIEERSGPGERFSGAAPYAIGKYVEHLLFRDADAVVTLTQLQAADVASGLFGRPPLHLATIPTCADYDAFCLRDNRPAKPVEGTWVPDAVRQRLAGKVVLGVVGSLNATYYVKEALTLARLATQSTSDVHLLVLSSQESEYEAALRSVGVSRDRYTLASVEHRAMPEWLQWIDWGLLLVPETIANRAKMPTKLAEFFATGVRPVFYGCNSDAARWVHRAGGGCVLPSVADAHLREAASAVAHSATEQDQLRRARELTAPHFALASGLDRYHRLIDACLSGGGSHPLTIDGEAR